MGALLSGIDTPSLTGQAVPLFELDRRQGQGWDWKWGVKRRAKANGHIQLRAHRHWLQTAWHQRALLYQEVLLREWKCPLFVLLLTPQMSPAITSLTVLIDRLLHLLNEQDLQLPPAFQSLSLFGFGV